MALDEGDLDIELRWWVETRAGALGDRLKQGASTDRRRGDAMRQRGLLLLLGGAMTTAPELRAQQKAVPA